MHFFSGLEVQDNYKKIKSRKYCQYTFKYSLVATRVVTHCFLRTLHKSSTDQNPTGPDYNSIRMLSWSHGLKCTCWHELICSLKRHVNRKHEEQSQNKDVVVTGANTAALLQTEGFYLI